MIFNGRSPPTPPDRAARLRGELALERRRLEEFESAVPESSTHLRLIARAIKAKKAKIAKLVEDLENTEAAQRAVHTDR